MKTVAIAILYINTPFQLAHIVAVVDERVDVARSFIYVPFDRLLVV
jgi:hypothetical protein